MDSNFLDQDIRREISKKNVIIDGIQHYTMSIHDISRGIWNIVRINDTLVADDPLFCMDLMNQVKSDPSLIYRYIFEWFCHKIKLCFINEKDKKIIKKNQRLEKTVTKITCYMTQTFVAEPYQNIYDHLNQIKEKNICFLHTFRSNIKRKEIHFVPNILSRVFYIYIDPLSQGFIINIKQYVEFGIIKELTLTIIKKNIEQKEINRKEMLDQFFIAEQSFSLDIIKGNIINATTWIIKRQSI